MRLRRRYGLARLRRIFQGMKYEVQAYTDKGWQAIYTASSMIKARKLAAEWRRKTGQATRIDHGPDHPTRRGR